LHKDPLRLDLRVSKSCVIEHTIGCSDQNDRAGEKVGFDLSLRCRSDTVTDFVGL
jgi:hypothetical protein